MNTKKNQTGGVKYPTYARLAAEVYAAIETECDAKNRAYAFILESGLLDEFRQWSSSHGESDAHGRAVEYLTRTAAAGDRYGD